MLASSEFSSFQKMSMKAFFLERGGGGGGDVPHFFLFGS